SQVGNVAGCRGCAHDREMLLGLSVLGYSLWRSVGLREAVPPHLHQPGAASAVDVCLVQVNSIDAPHCGYGPLPLATWPKQYVAAVSSVNPLATGFPMEGCGACLRVVCTDPRPGVCRAVSPAFTAADVDANTTSAPQDGALSAGPSSLVVQVVERCTTCGPAGIALHAAAFDQLIAAPQTDGVAVSYLRVPCRPPGNMKLRIIEMRRSDGGYIKLAIMDVNGFGELVEVELARSGLQVRPTSLGPLPLPCAHLLFPISLLAPNATAARMQHHRDAIPANATAGEYPLLGQFL
ncbi:hypothetical protein QJQ45_023735, partial [Haematococcus lacustris]